MGRALQSEDSEGQAEGTAAPEQGLGVFRVECSLWLQL